MDDCLCRVALDFGGRAWLVWDAEFHREKIGEMPTEMFLHFFKSLSDAARMNLNIKAEGQNEHHKIEGIFKALARAIKMAVRRDIYHFEADLLFYVVYSSSHSFSHEAALASLGIRQSPRGLSDTDPTLGPSGRQERLNCC